MDTDPLETGAGGGTWGWKGAADENQSLSAPNYSSSREGSHFKWKLVFWLLLYPLDQSRSLSHPWKIRCPDKTAFPSGPRWVWCFISFLSVPSDPRLFPSETAPFRYWESISAQAIGPGWDVPCCTWSSLPRLLPSAPRASRLALPPAAQRGLGTERKAWPCSPSGSEKK